MPKRRLAARAIHSISAPDRQWRAYFVRLSWKLMSGANFVDQLRLSGLGNSALRLYRRALVGKAGWYMADTTGTAMAEAVITDGDDGVRRRDFINVAAVSAAGVGAAGTLLPLISQMAPSADVLAESTTEVDVSAIQPGQAIKAIFRKQPLFVKRLTPKEIEEANNVDVSSLRDPQTLAERTKEGNEDILVTMGVCTHLGCVPLGAAEGEVKGEYGGYFCPCHGSQFDTAARIRKGPAPTNLEVPDYEFTSETVITVG